MKKFLSVLLTIISVICLSFAFGGCGNEHTTAENNDTGNKRGSFYTVTEAYEKGYLTRGQVMSIAYYHNDGNYKNEEIMGEDYTPLPLTPETLSDEIDTALKNSFYNSDLWEKYKDTNTKDDIRYAYYGKYGHTVVVKIGAGVEAVGDEVWEENVDGVIIYYRNTKRLTVWVSTMLYADDYDFEDNCIIMMLDDDYADIAYIKSIFKNYSIEEIKYLTPAMNINIYSVRFSFHDKMKILEIVDLFADTEGVNGIEPNFIFSCA